MAKELRPIRVKIKNFQSIENLDFEIKGFTCITGKTNIGKSAIVRAISSSILNNPVVGMVRKGASFSSVELKGEGWGFLWEKAEKGVNRYTIEDKTYDKVGAKQLPEIESLGFKSVRIGDDEINPWFASQFSPIFLLDKSGPQVTNFISEVSRLKVLQDSVTISARGKKQSNDEASLKAKEASKIRSKQKALEPILTLKKVESELKDQIDSIGEYETRYKKAVFFKTSIEKDSLFVEKIFSVESVKIPKELDVDLINKFKKLSQFKNGLENSAKRIIKIKPILKVSIPDEIDTTEFFKLKKFSSIPKLKTRVSKLESISSVTVPEESVSEIEKLSNLKIFSYKMEGEKNATKKLKEEYSKIEEELISIENEISQIKVCPTCSKPI